MEFEIKEGVPLPVGRGKPRKYDIPLEKMNKGGIGIHKKVSLCIRS